ncbi:MAG: response regulator [Bacteroidales bacterium]
MGKINNIIIADDHPLFRMGVKTLIDNLEDCNVVGEANDGEETMQLIYKCNVDIAILDLDMPKKSGYEVAKKINKNHPDIKIIYLTSHSDLELFQKAYETGFSGFLFKESALEEMEECLKSITENKLYISQITKQFIKKHQEELEHIKNLEKSLNQLTNSEKKVLREIAKQKTTKEIAEELFNSYKTIENHRLNICQKLNIKGTNNLLSFALQNKEAIERITDKR